MVNEHLYAMLNDKLKLLERIYITQFNNVLLDRMDYTIFLQLSYFLFLFSVLWLLIFKVI